MLTSGILNQMTEWWFTLSQYPWRLASIVGVVLLLALTIWQAKRSGRRYRLYQRELSYWKEVHDLSSSQMTRSEFLRKMLEFVFRIVPVSSQYAYLPEPKGEAVVLVMAKQDYDVPLLGPQYTTLIMSESTGEEYRPSARVLMTTVPQEVVWMGENTPFWAIPLVHENQIVGLVQVGPLGPKAVSKSMIRILDTFRPAIARLVHAMNVRQLLSEQTEELAAMADVGGLVTQTSMGGTAGMTNLLKVAIQGATADAGFILLFEGGVHRMGVTVGLDDALVDKLHESPVETGLLSNEYGKSEKVSFVAVPPSGQLTQAGFLTQWIFPMFSAHMFLGLMVCLSKQAVVVGPDRLRAVALLANRVALAITSFQIQQTLTHEYLQTLITMVDFSDRLKEHTVGHSGRVSKYARELAVAVGLPRHVVDGVSIGGYLHDVGMSSIIEIVNNKNGRLSSNEYEEVKNHATIGALMVNPVSEPVPLAPLIKHHHERWDGWGYPDGLAGDQIPLGARIIAVADTFTAMISNRSYRGALSLTQALENMNKLAGTQLDPELVTYFLRMWEHRQADPTCRDKALEECHKMRQVPADTCVDCPARMRSRRCWEVRGHLCHLHGDDCQQCLVYTEFQYRQNPVH